MAISERPLVDAARMAIDEVNTAGGVLGHQVEVVVGNGKSSPEIFKEEALRLITHEGAAALFGCWTSASRKTVKEVVESEGSLLWYPLQYEGLEQSEHIVYTGSCLNQQVWPLVQWCLGHNIRRLALVGSDYVFPRTANKLIRAYLSGTTSTVVEEKYCALDRNDFGDMLAALSDAEPEIIINSINGQGNLHFFRQLGSLENLAGKVPVCSLSCGETEFLEFGASADGHLACWGYFQSIDTPVNQAFLSRIRARGGSVRASSDPFATAYSQVHLWAEIVKRLGTASPSEMLGNLAGHAILCPLGRLEIQANQHVLRRALLGRYRGAGEFHIIWRSETEIPPLPWMGLEESRIPSRKLLIDLLKQVPGESERDSRLHAESSERAKAQKALRASEDLFGSLFVNSPVGIALYDDRGGMVAMNSVARGIFGLEAHALLPAYHLFDDPCVSRETKRRIQAGHIVTEERFLSDCPDAGPLAGESSLGSYVHFTYAPYGYQDGVFTGIIAVVQDITERKRSEALLAETVAKFRGFFEDSPLGMFVLDGNGVIVAANPAVAAILGMPVTSYPGINLAETMSEGVHKEALLKGLRDGDSAAEGPYASVFTGRTHVLRTRLRRVSDMFLILMEDTTELTRMREAMVQSEKMMSLGGLAAGMAHEINNPLGGIVQSIQVVMRRVLLDLPANVEAARETGCDLDKVRAFFKKRDIGTLLEAVDVSAKRAAQIVRNMLEFCRKSDLAHTAADINAVLDKAVDLCASDYDLRGQYDFRKIRIERDYASALPPVYCAVTEIEQVFMNLLRNAAQALCARPSGEGGPRIVLRSLLEKDMIRIDIEDNGPGMDAQTRRRVFEPFFATKEVGKGTGLGLSVAYFIIHNNHGGTLTVESEPGKGARFMVRLPAAAREEHGQEAGQGPQPAFCG